MQSLGNEARQSNTRKREQNLSREVIGHWNILTENSFIYSHW